MVFCRSCQSSFPAELVVCPECHQTLVERVEIVRPVASAPDDSWVAVATFKESKFAKSTKKALDANNIPSLLMSKSFAQPLYKPVGSKDAHGSTGFYLERLLMVPREYKDEAKIILKITLKTENRNIVEK